MLGSEETFGALFHGIELDTEGLTAEELSALSDAADQLKTLQLWVPGDTVYGEPTAYRALLGIPARVRSANDDPAQVTLEHLTEAEEAFAGAIDELDALASDYPVVSAARHHDPATYLTCCGPLPYTEMSFGELMSSDDYEDATYTFHSQQNMRQEWAPEGVDGVTIAHVEWDSIAKVQVDEERTERLRDKVATQESPAYWLSVRFD
jgi:hypothetical protein